jgi:hypothetical protein
MRQYLLFTADLPMQVAFPGFFFAFSQLFSQHLSINTYDAFFKLIIIFKLKERPNIMQ